MSYTIEIFANPLPQERQQALAEAAHIKEDYLQESGKIHPSLRKLHAQLVKQYPCLSSYDEDDQDQEDCPWSDGPLINNFGSQMAMLGISNHQDEVLAFIILCSGKLGLTVIDPQEGVVYQPNDMQAIAYIQKQQQLAAQKRPWSGKVVRDTVLAHVAPLMARHGFVLKKSQSGFVRRFEGGNHYIGFSILNYNPEFQFSYAVSVNLDAVSALDKKIYGAESDCTTMHSNRERMTGVKPRPKVENFEEFPPLLDELSEQLEKIVLPFLDQCRDPVGVDQKMNPPILPGYDRSERMERRALMVAWLANNPNFLGLVDYYRDYIKGYSQDYRDHLEQAISYLLQHKNEE
ncbi:hypothetical protein [Undibacterium sp. TJN19]|uniref:hypothetical protein n=1 Tax=Undibacterium sp. TJN19 TaxID=3413055 RepID=UPI003BF25F61